MDKPAPQIDIRSRTAKCLLEIMQDTTRCPRSSDGALLQTAAELLTEAPDPRLVDAFTQLDSHLEVLWRRADTPEVGESLAEARELLGSIRREVLR